APHPEAEGVARAEDELGAPKGEAGAEGDQEELEGGGAHGLRLSQGGWQGPPWKGGYLISLGFQPQAGGRGAMTWPSPSHLGLKPQAGEYPPFQGGPTTHQIKKG